MERRTVLKYLLGAGIAATVIPLSLPNKPSKKGVIITKEWTPESIAGDAFGNECTPTTSAGNKICVGDTITIDGKPYTVQKVVPPPPRAGSQVKPIRF